MWKRNETILNSSNILLRSDPLFLHDINAKYGKMIKYMNTNKIPREGKV